MSPEDEDGHKRNSGLFPGHTDNHCKTNSWVGLFFVLSSLYTKVAVYTHLFGNK